MGVFCMKDLEILLSSFGKDRSLVQKGLAGECDAFAFALFLVLQARHPEIKIAPVLVERRRMGLETGNMIEYNPFSHVLLEITLSDGKVGLVDAAGMDADERWEEDWIQPSEEDEEELCEDVFSYIKTTFDAIQVRRGRDRKYIGIDPSWMKKFEEALEGCLKTMETPAPAAAEVQAHRRNRLRA